jgi:hypothetical protein
MVAAHGCRASRVSASRRLEVNANGIFFAALAVDVVYQLVQLGWVYLGEALIIAQIVALVPYVLIRGVANRIARMLIY